MVLLSILFGAALGVGIGGAIVLVEKIRGSRCKNGHDQETGTLL